MARATAKRKAQTAVDSKQIKGASRGTKEGRYDETDDAEDGDITARQTPELSVTPKRKFRGRTTESSRPTRSSEYEEDLGRTKGQQFLRKSMKSAQKGASAKRTKKFLAEFGLTVQKEAEDFNNQLQKYEIELEIHDEKYLRAFGLAHLSLLTSNTSDQRHSESRHGTADNKLYQMSQTVIQRAHKLVHGFEDSAEKLASMQKSFSSDKAWEKEVEDVREVIQIGKDVGRQRLSTILKGSRSSGRPGSDAAVSENFYRKGSGDLDDMNWGHIARTQEKAVRRLVRTLPRE